VPSVEASIFLLRSAISEASELRVSTLSEMVDWVSLLVEARVLAAERNRLARVWVPSSMAVMEALLAVVLVRSPQSEKKLDMAALMPLVLDSLNRLSTPVRPE